MTDEGFLDKIDGPFIWLTAANIMSFTAMLADWHLYRYCGFDKGHLRG